MTSKRKTPTPVVVTGDAPSTALTTTAPTALTTRTADDEFKLGLLEAARDPAFDVGKLERLIQLQVEDKARRAKEAFDRDFAAMQGELPIISEKGTITVAEKDQDGQRTGSNRVTPFARHSDIKAAIRPVLAQYGFGLRFRHRMEGPLLIVVGILSHRDGHFETDEFQTARDDSGKKNVIQSWGSARSYAQRYLTRSLLDLASEQDHEDTNGFAPEDVAPPSRHRDAPAPPPARHNPKDGEVITEKQRNRLYAIVSKSGRSQQVVKEWLRARYGYASSKDITRADYEAICTAVEAKGPLALDGGAAVREPGSDDE